MVLQTFKSGLRSGLFFLSIGVGTVAIKILQPLISEILFVRVKLPLRHSFNFFV